jgi:hypothetical protein
LFTSISAFYLAHEKNIEQDLKPKTTTKLDKKKTEGGMKPQTEKINEKEMKNQTKTDVNKVEKTEKNVTHHEKHKHTGEKSNPEETNSGVE